MKIVQLVKKTFQVVKFSSQLPQLNSGVNSICLNGVILDINRYKWDQNWVLRESPAFCVAFQNTALINPSGKNDYLKYLQSYLLSKMAFSVLKEHQTFFECIICSQHWNTVPGIFVNLMFLDHVSQWIIWHSVNIDCFLQLRLQNLFSGMPRDAVTTLKWILHSQCLYCVFAACKQNHVLHLDV